MLIFALYDELVAKSDVVRELLDDWFRSQRGTIWRIQHATQPGLRAHSVARSGLRTSFAAAARTQLDLAGEHCAFVAASRQENASPCETLRAEITLRKNDSAHDSAHHRENDGPGARNELRCGPEATRLPRHVVGKSKGFRDFVSEADLASESVILDAITTNYPEHAFCPKIGQNSHEDSDYL